MPLWAFLTAAFLTVCRAPDTDIWARFGSVHFSQQSRRNLEIRQKPGNGGERLKKNQRIR